MAAPLGISGRASTDHRRRKNGASAEAFAKYRQERNAEKGRQVWSWDDESKKLGHWTRVPIS
jgi:hypothetical protein